MKTEKELEIEKEVETKKKVKQQAGVSVITVTNKPWCMKNLFRNFKHQTWQKRELIIILNHNTMKPKVYQDYARRMGIKATVYQLPASKRLGECLNYGIRKASYSYIAKCDDDDYYAPGYLAEGVRKAVRTGADLIGKNRFYIYMKESKELVLLKKKRQSIAGATLLFRKKLYPNVKFTRRRAGSDMKFLADVKKRGGAVESTSHRHYAAIRNADQSKHTWTFDRKVLFKNMKAVVVARTAYYERLVRNGKS